MDVYRSSLSPACFSSGSTRGAEKLQIGEEIEKVDLHPVATGVLQALEPVDDLLGRAHQVHVAADRPGRFLVPAPGGLVARAEGPDEVVEGDPVGAIQDPAVLRPRLALGVAADDVGIDDDFDVAPLSPGRLADPGGVGGERFECRLGLGARGRGDEDQVGVARGIVDAGGRTAGVYQHDPPVDRFRRHVGALRPPPAPLEIERFLLRPKAPHHRGEFVRHGIALVMCHRRQAEHAKFALLVAGDHVQAPASAAHVIDHRAVFRQVQGVPAIEDVNRGDQQHPLGHGRQAGRGDEGVESVFAELDLAAIAVLAEPLRQREDQIEAQFVRPPGQLGVVVEAPVGAARRLRRAPGALLVRQEETQYQGVARRLGQRLVHPFAPSARLGHPGPPQEIGANARPVSADR